MALMALNSYQGVFAQEAEKLTEELMWAYCVRVNNLEISDDIILAYVRSKDRDLARELTENKFQFHREKEKYRAELQSIADNFDFSKEYKIIMNASFGEYDFEKLGYPTGYYTAQSPSFDSERFFRWHFLGIGEYHNLHVTNDYEHWFFLPIAPDNAESRELGLKEKEAKSMLYINEVYASIMVKLSDKPTSTSTNVKSKKATNKDIADSIKNEWDESAKKELLPYTLHGDITSIKFYDDDKYCRDNYIGEIKRP